jgi:hypothetical protein
VQQPGISIHSPVFACCARSRHCSDSSSCSGTVGFLRLLPHEQHAVLVFGGHGLFHLRPPVTGGHLADLQQAAMILADELVVFERLDLRHAVAHALRGLAGAFFAASLSSGSSPRYW